MNNNKELIKKRDDILNFFKEAFIIDGNIQFATDEENKILNKKKVNWIRLEDSKRGIFYVGVNN